MSDRHTRILEMAARHSQHQLDEHDAIDAIPNAASKKRRQDLKQRATRTRARVTAAQARRRHRPVATQLGRNAKPRWPPGRNTAGTAKPSIPSLTRGT